MYLKVFINEKLKQRHMVDKVNDFECPSSTKNQSLGNYDYKYCLHIWKP